MMAEGGEGSFSFGSEIVFDFFCELCIDDNKQVEAEGYCVDCREYLCGSCYSGHRKTRATRYHVLQDKNTMPKDTPLSTDRVSKAIITKCKVHSDKHVEYYCQSHAVLGCSTCFVSVHRGCQGIENIVDISENILESQWYSDFIVKLQLIQKKSRDVEARALENKTASKRYCSDVVLMVRKMKEEAIEILNVFEKDTVKLAEKMMSEDEEKMESVVGDCKVLSEKIEKLLSEFELLQSSKRVCQLYVNMRETVGEVKTLQESLSKLEVANVVRTFTFDPNTEFTSLLRRQNALGKISHQIQQIRNPNPVTTRDPLKITAKKLADICVKSSSDTGMNCMITGSVVVSNNLLIITDANKHSIKLVDTPTNKLYSTLKLSSQPWDITVFNRTQAAVTLPDSKKIIIMKLSPSLAQEREIPVRGRCRGVTYSTDRLLVTFVDNPRLEIIDLRGNIIRTIENDRDGRKMFKQPDHVCVSKDGETVYVSDNDRNTVTRLKYDGVVNALYKDEELRGARKVCTDHHGNVYVCGFLSKNVLMITADCKKGKVILTQADGLDSNVCSVSHCQDTNRLFVGMVGDIVKIYKLS